MLRVCTLGASLLIIIIIIIVVVVVVVMSNGMFVGINVI